MLTAKNKNGKTLCLGHSFNKETLLTLREREEFFCPVCEEKVILKLGERKIFHFSHIKGGSCREFYENETEYHMEGKLKLFQWLRKQEIPAVLEYYDREIQQRPDILFQYNSQKYALEFQCSTISEEIFKRRTGNYFSRDYVPLWILGDSQLKEKYRNSSGLTNFHYLFLRHSTNGQSYIPSFSPEQNTLKILYSIFPFSTKNVLLQKSARPIHQWGLQELLDPFLVSSLNMNEWRKANEHYKLHWSLYPNSQQHSFLTEMYNHHLNLFLFPAEIGLPVSHGLLLQTSPFIWQAYYYIDLLQNKIPGERISFQLLESSFKKRVMKKEIILRNFPQIENMNPLSAYFDYSLLLEKLGVLVRKPGNSFQVQRPLMIPQTNREKEEQTNHFFKQYRQILEKN